MPLELVALHIGRTHTSFCPRYLEKYWHGIHLSDKASFPWLWNCYLCDTALDLAIPNLGVVHLTNVLLEATEGSRLTFLVCHDSHSNVCIKKEKKKAQFLCSQDHAFFHFVSFNVSQDGYAGVKITRAW